MNFLEGPQIDPGFMVKIMLFNNKGDYENYIARLIAMPAQVTQAAPFIYIESLMSCHLLLNLLHELANMILCEDLPSIISFLPTNVINLVINDNEFEILFIT